MTTKERAEELYERYYYTISEDTLEDCLNAKYTTSIMATLKPAINPIVIPFFIIVGVLFLMLSIKII